MSLPLPAITPENEQFWTAGGDGRLVIKRCAECGRFHHPTVLVCVACGRLQLDWAEVSGAANVVALTENHQPWAPDLPTPYLLAVVALVDAPEVRLTTRLIGIELTDEVSSISIGDGVTVVFEQVDDVWLPLFAPATNVAPVAVELPLPTRFHRSPAFGERFEQDVALTGIGMSEIGRRLGRPAVSLAVEAAREAIADAGLEPSDIDGMATYPGPGIPGFSEGGVTAMIDAHGISPTWHAGGVETSGQTGSVVNAMLAVSAGLCRHVLCFRTVTEGSLRHQRRGRSQPPTRLADDMMAYRIPFGAMSAANWIALAASQYQHRYGLDRETLGWIALNARANAALNPFAIYREPLTMDDYLSARMVTTPLGLYDCDVPCDGSIAVVVSHRDAAVDLRRIPVGVAAVGTGVSERQSWDQGTLTHEPNVFGPATHLWSRTDLRHGDVDVAELYDGFTFNCLTWLEALGFCEVGEAADFLEGGRRIALDGELPLNTHGGQLSAGRLHGFGFLHEAIVQLRGEAGLRQVAGAEVALVASGGGTPGGALLLTRDLR